METIDLLNLQPSKITKGLSGKFVAIYGKEKVGKTTFAAQPRNLICAFEIGTNYLNNIYTQRITKWNDFKTVVRQLENPEVQKKYDTIAIDTYPEAYAACEDYICASNQVKKIGDIPYGGSVAAALKSNF